MFTTRKSMKISLVAAIAIGCLTTAADSIVAQGRRASGHQLAARDGLSQTRSARTIEQTFLVPGKGRMEYKPILTHGIDFDYEPPVVLSDMPTNKDEACLPGTFTFMPPHVAGDKDFKGHGSNVRVDALAHHDGRKVLLTVYWAAVLLVAMFAVFI